MSERSKDIDDATVVVNHIDETVVVNDATVVVNAPPNEPADAASAATGAGAAGGESTTRGPRRGRYAQADEIDDRTIAVAQPTDAAHPPAASQSGAAATQSGYVTYSGTGGSAVDEPVTGVNQVLPYRGGPGLDPSRPIAPAPGMMPWEALPSGERGLTQGLPVSYGARPNTEVLLQTGMDAVHREIGPAPVGQPVAVRSGRDGLPSLERRERRRSKLTLAIYGAVVVACVFGLWRVAAIAFGW